LRLALAVSTFAIITYAMVLLEPKDRVLYRWLGAELSRGHLDRVVSGLQGWMMSYLAGSAVVVALIVWLANNQAFPAAAYVGSAFGFLTRDVAIFVLLQTLSGPRRGDFAAVATLFALYVLAPAILNGLDLKQALVVFYPETSQPIWLSPAIAWAEALTVASMAVGRVALNGRAAAAST